jgi:hypothetical protein
MGGSCVCAREETPASSDKPPSDVSPGARARPILAGDYVTLGATAGASCAAATTDCARGIRPEPLLGPLAGVRRRLVERRSYIVDNTAQAAAQYACQRGLAFAGVRIEFADFLTCLLYLIRALRLIRITLLYILTGNLLDFVGH